MIEPSFEEFKKLAKKGNVIPVCQDIPGDLETPVSAFLKIGQGAYAFLLESVESKESIGRYSFLSSSPSLVFESKREKVTVRDFSGSRRRVRSYACAGSPLLELKKIQKDFHFVPRPGLPRFCGGLVGFLGYDMVRFYERVPDENVDDLELPDAVFLLSETLVIFDHFSRSMKIVSNAFVEDFSDSGLRRSYARSCKRIKAVMKLLKRSLKAEKKPLIKKSIKFESNVTKSQFKRAVIRVKEYIKAGDAIQVVLSQRFRVNLKKDPVDVYRSLRSINPSPYMFCLRLGQFSLVGSSPELLVRCEDGRLETRPIAGTRPRGKSEKEDEGLCAELLSDAKEKAEHLMLVDLGRNDLGRVSSMGSVKVSEFMKVEKYSHVMHIVSSVEGRLKKGFDPMDALVACFPAGTVSGAPKIRAMEIIDELETTRRGPYAGAIGYFSFSGNLDSCIIIRTVVVTDKASYVQAGAGIVSDSDPECEYQETVNKARALLEAIRIS